TELIDHHVDGLLELENLAFRFRRDLSRQIALGDRCRNIGDVADLTSEARRHRIHIVSEIFPGSADAGHFCLSTEFSFGAYFLGDASYFGGKSTELVDHG